MIYAPSSSHQDISNDASNAAEKDAQLNTQSLLPPPDRSTAASLGQDCDEGEGGNNSAPPLNGPNEPLKRAPDVKLSTKPRSTRSWHMHETAMVGLVLAGLFTSYLAWRLSVGTVSINVLAPVVEDALEKVVGGQPKIGQLRLGWDKDKRDFIVSATKIIVKTDARTSPLALGQVNLTLNARALLAGRAQVTRADLIGVQAVLIIDKDGRTAFGFGTAEEVLELPRARAKARGLRAILDDMRRTLLRDGTNGRVEAISLREGLLTLIDPDTGQRLTLSDARANIFSNAENVVIMQAAGFIREMGGTADIAIAGSPDPKQRLAVAALFENARFSVLPASVHVGPLAQIAKITTPISGDLLAYLGSQSSGIDARGKLRLGGGRVSGVAISSASGAFSWDGARGNLTFKNVSAKGSQFALQDGSGEIGLLLNDRRAITFTAKGFEYSNASLGRLTGTAVTGRGQLDANNLPEAGTLSARTLNFERAGAEKFSAQSFELVLTRQRGRGNSRQNLAVKSQEVNGTMPGRTVELGNVNLLIETITGADGFSPSLMTGSLEQIKFGQSGRGGGLSLQASGVGFSASQFSMQTLIPRRVQARVANLRIDGVMVDSMQGSSGSAAARNIVTNASLIATTSAHISGPIDVLARRNDGRRSIAISGRALVLDVTQLDDIGAKINAFQAASLSVRHPQFALTTTDLSGAGAVLGTALTNTEISAKTIEIRSDHNLVRPFWADSLRLEGNIGARGVDLCAFAFRHRGVDLAGSTLIELSPRGSAKVDLEADVRGTLSVETLLSAWPVTFLRETRETIRKLVPLANAQVSHLSLAIPAGMIKKQILPRSGINLSFSVRDATVTYLPGMSPITGVSGSGTLTGNSLAMSFNGGVIGNSVLSNATLEIPEFKQRGAQAVINAKISGDVTEIAREIDLPPLATFTKAQFDPSRLSGIGEAALTISLPLKSGLLADEIGIEVDGQIKNAGLTRTFAGLNAANGNVSLSVTNKTVEVAGTAWLAGNLFNFDWASQNVPGIPAAISLAADGDVTIDSLKALGLDFTTYAQGPVSVEVTTSSQGAALGEALVKANFRNTNINLPNDIWTKKPNGDGRATAKIYQREGGGWNIQDLRFDADGVTVRGALDLTDSGGLVDARFSRFVIDGAGDLSIDVTPADTGLTITMRGEYLNLTPFLIKQNISVQAVELFDRPLSLSADIKRVATSADASLTNVHADIIRDHLGWRILSAEGESPTGSSQVRLTMQQDGTRSISGTFSDAGYFARLLYPGAPLFGGTGMIEGELPVVGASSSGKLTFIGKDIRFARLGASPVLFDAIALPMTVRGGVITLRNGQAGGDAYTVKAAGYVDLGAGSVDIRGVATPGGLNRILADIPLFGPILGGGTDEGLLGVTFRAQGLLASPRLRTNPISALAPGFLRKIFESEPPLSPQPRLVVATFAGEPIGTKLSYGPTEDMTELYDASGQSIGPTQ